ncbi:MAG TPA: class I SAM-dependent methyltransferase [Acidimicrobiales bacterium]
MTVNEEKLMGYVHQAVGDFGAILTGALVTLGDKLGLFAALAGAGPLTAEELAARTDTDERYVREWASGLAAAGYVDYAGNGRYRLNEEQAVALADETSPAYVIGGFQAMLAATRILPRAVEAFRTGEGIGWHEHDPDLFQGTERFFRPGYLANLVQAWLPALDGVTAKLDAGAKVADVGCGYGASTIILAKAFPASQFWGFDYHEGSIDAARKAAAEAGVADRVTFVVASGHDYPGTDFDLVCHFDCLHDMGDPVGAAAHTRRSLKPDGTWLLVEPFANDDVADNLNPVGRVFYSASTLICTPASKSQDVGAALGAQAGEGRLREVADAAGFSSFRRATETPFNLVLEGRP